MEFPGNKRERLACGSEFFCSVSLDEDVVKTFPGVLRKTCAILTNYHAEICCCFFNVDNHPLFEVINLFVHKSSVSYALYPVSHVKLFHCFADRCILRTVN